MKSIVFFDLEVNSQTRQVVDAGSVDEKDRIFHKPDLNELRAFLQSAVYVAGHNIFAHDLEFLKRSHGDAVRNFKCIDTLLLSPILFPKIPYHALLKDEKLVIEELNNPVNDSKKARELFYDEVTAFKALPPLLQAIFYGLIGRNSHYSAFFDFCEFQPIEDNLKSQIEKHFKGQFCAGAELPLLIKNNPVELAYAFAIINCNDRYSITPPWVLKNFPEVDRIIRLLRNTPCVEGCPYCDDALNPEKALKRYFGYDSFRLYEGRPLQRDAVYATLKQKSILSIFPTGGGKSITFQVPALMAGDNEKALTVIISPLQSLMKDQVDNLEKHGITDAVTINGLLDPIERGKAIERIENGQAFLLYIAPESLRSNTIERILLKRKIARFVIDEAHCFSSWGQDFRVDYLYIADFIRNLEQKKNLSYRIPVSCFTATAKPKVIDDIKEYFRSKLQVDLEVFRAGVARKNLEYKVLQQDQEEEKYTQLRHLIEDNPSPTIVYVSRTKRAYKLAERLTQDGYPAKPYHGKMDKDEKSANQDAFMKGEVDIIVATSAFGMGVDKSNIGKVIHFDISDSLENYVQEAGRAGRDQSIQAECFVLYNEEDLHKHFVLLNQTKINQKEINQIWKAIKDLTRSRQNMSNSALEIARKAGWDETVADLETRVTTAVAALEDAGYLKRGQNFPRVFANSILSKSAQEAIEKIRASDRFSETEQMHAERIIKKLFSSRSKLRNDDEVAEARVDYIADQLGIVRHEVIRVIEQLRAEGILADNKDLTAFVNATGNRSATLLSSHIKCEETLLSFLKAEAATYNLKELNEQISARVSDCTVSKLRTILNFWAVKNWIKKNHPEGQKNLVDVELVSPLKELNTRFEKRQNLSAYTLRYLTDKAKPDEENSQKEEQVVEFSVSEVAKACQTQMFGKSTTLDDVEDILFYLSRIEAIKIEGGFMVVYNKLRIERLETNNRIQYKDSDYEKLKTYYQQRVQQIHIVGEYARKMIRNYSDALQFVDDYFTLTYDSFLRKYFPGSRREEINRSLTPEKFRQLFGSLAPDQLEIIKDSESQKIVIAAGPGSGKTRVLVHKLASLILAEDVKHEQLLMLAFSRAAVNEFKKRLVELIGNVAYFIGIKTFHSYCFDLIGRPGTLEKSDRVIEEALSRIKPGEIEPAQLFKTVLVVDEAQDMNRHEFQLVKALMDINPEMRIILVGDPDQNIYEFRGASSEFMKSLIAKDNAKLYQLPVNYRSSGSIVQLAEWWRSRLVGKMRTEASVSHSDELGSIQITEYSKTNILVPLVNKVATAELTGSTAVLVRTNSEVFEVAGILTAKGVPIKIIQSNDGFSVQNIREIRYLSEILLNTDELPDISEDVWLLAGRQLRQEFSDSNKLSLAEKVLSEFQAVHQKKKYKSDWKTFIAESSLEDLIAITSDMVYVSTFHKAKGKEFDSVYLLIDRTPVTDEENRVIYVAVTRAKKLLHIHTRPRLFSGLQISGMTFHRDNGDHPQATDICIHLGHRDVYLDHFKQIHTHISRLSAGMKLSVNQDGLSLNGSTVVKFSTAFREQILIKHSQGFVVNEGTVNFLVYWRPPNQIEEKEHLIVLPELRMTRKLTN
jgi:ATP-dependent DNA helicase RecQ